LIYKKKNKSTLRIIFLLLLLSLFNLTYSQSQSQTFNYTGQMQTWVVPPCVTQINVVAAGAKGGGNVGGNGTRITATINVTPGQTLNIYVGGMGTCGSNSGGWNGGGTGHASTPVNATYNSCGGGGATDIRIGGTALANRVIVAGGGGGKGGGSNTNTPGGTANCNNGGAGGNTFGAGGGGGTQFSGGAGGAPWAGTPPGGSPGTLGNGAGGGFWQTASGGGGGGGYYGGGGGGNDGCCTGSNGGGGGGAGSSLVPAGGTCLAGNNNNHGYLTITWTAVNLVVNPTFTNVTCFNQCNGTANANISGPGITYLWSPGGQTTQSITGLCPGTYQVVVSQNGCQTTAQVTITQPPQIVVNPTLTNVTCFGLCDGTANANVAGVGVTYLWSPGGQTTQSITGLCPGTYNVTVTQSGCQSNGQVTITQPPQIILGPISHN
jgi:hypothetical protein